MLDALAQRQVVLVGETHLDDNTHRIERAVLEGIARRKPGKVVLALEMFQRDVQPVLDAYLQGDIDEATFRREARVWGNYQTGYRPLVELAKAHGIPVVAANLPADLQRELAMKGAAALSSLTAGERAMLPLEIHPPHDGYWSRLGRRLRDRFHGHDASASLEARRYAVQNLWDNSMAQAALEALQADRERTVLLIAGGFHVEYGQGIAHQIRVREPATDLALVTILPTFDLQGIEPESDRARADYVVYTPARARGPERGSLAVIIPGQMEFHIHVPDITTQDSLPLLVWLGETGASTVDDQRYWSIALGDEAIVVTVEPPFVHETSDLRLAGRWWWPHRFERDLSHVTMGLDRLLEFVVDRYPVDSSRIVVAGRGQGATAILWAGLYADLSARVVAWGPRGADGLASHSLPETPSRIPGLTLVGGDETLGQTFEAAGIERVHSRALPEDGARHALEDLLRRELALAKKLWPKSTETLSLAVDSEIGRQWAAAHARLAERGAKSIRVVVGEAERKSRSLTVSPSEFTDGLALPLAPGRFGGTTILVLSSGVDAETRRAWKTLAETNAIEQRSRFASLHVTDDAGLPNLLEDLRARGRKSILVVPAVFVATPQRMQALQAKVAGHDVGLEIDWLPGLGGELARARAARASGGEASAPR